MDRRPTLRVWEYELEGGWRCLAGRTDRDNDRLTFGVARPKDLWLHVRGHPGSHVVLRVADASPDRAVKKAAAGIAAWHSRLREGGMVAVSCTEARFVSKPQGAKAGTVSIRNEEVIQVRPSLAGARLVAEPSD